MSEFPPNFKDALAHNLAEKLAKQQVEMFTFGQSAVFVENDFIQDMASLTDEERRSVVNDALKKMGEVK